MADQIGALLDKDQNSETLTLKILSEKMAELLSLSMTSLGEGKYLSEQITGLAGTASNPKKYFSYFQYTDGTNSVAQEFSWDGTQIVEQRSPITGTGTGTTTIIQQGGDRKQSNVVPYEGGEIFQTPYYTEMDLRPDQDKKRTLKYAGI